MLGSGSFGGQESPSTRLRRASLPIASLAILSASAASIGVCSATFESALAGAASGTLHALQQIVIDAVGRVLAEGRDVHVLPDQLQYLEAVEQLQLPDLAALTGLELDRCEQPSCSVREINGKAS